MNDQESAEPLSLGERHFGRVFIWSLGTIMVAVLLCSLLQPLGHPRWVFPDGHGREPALRAETLNNLKQIAISYQNKVVSDPYVQIPPVAIVDPEGKPLLSWRVLLLPELEQQELFDKFDLTKPWDSPENLPLVEQMPGVFASPFARSAAEQGRTPYKAIVSDHEQWNTAWPRPGEKLTQRKLKDGPHHTALVVEDLTDPVIWTKPVDITPTEYLQTLDHGQWSSKAFPVGYADGAVRTFIDPTPEEIVPLLYADDGKVAKW